MRLFKKLFLFFLLGIFSFSTIKITYANSDFEKYDEYYDYSGRTKKQVRDAFKKYINKRRNKSSKKKTIKYPNMEENRKKWEEIRDRINKIESGELPKPENSARPVNTYNRGIRLKIHGNWCGPGHGAVEGYYADTPAVDVLDQGCKLHDICYLEKGSFDIECDRAFVKYIDENKNKMSLGEKILAGIIRIIFNR